MPIWEPFILDIFHWRIFYDLVPKAKNGLIFLSMWKWNLFLSMAMTQILLGDETDKPHKNIRF